MKETVRPNSMQPQVRRCTEVPEKDRSVTAPEALEGAKQLKGFRSPEFIKAVLEESSPLRPLP